MRSNLLVALLLIAGCSADGDAPASALRMDVEEVERYGSREGVGSAFTAIAAVTATPSELFVLESGVPRVAVFSRDNGWIRNIGREGDGPGELRQPATLGFRSDQIWVGDPRGGRLELFSRDGDPLRSIRWSLPADSQGVVAVPTALFSDGSVLAGPNGLPIGSAFRGAVSHRTYYRASDDGADPIELYQQPVVLEDFASVEVSGGRQLLVTHPHPQEPLVRTVPDGSGILVIERYGAHSETEAEFSVRVIQPDGSVRHGWSIGYLPMPAVRWRERAMERMSQNMLERSGTVDRTLLSAIAEALSDLAYYPPVTDAVAGQDGSIWLRREDILADSVRWEAYSASGQDLAAVFLPADAEVMAASGRELWVVETDELDVPFVSRLRVVEGESGRAP